MAEVNLQWSLKYTNKFFNTVSLFLIKKHAKSPINSDFKINRNIKKRYCFYTISPILRTQRNAVKSMFSLQMLLVNYSHSIVAGGLLVISYTTRLMCATSFTNLVDIFSNTSQGIRAQSEVIPSTEVTARIPMV